MNHHRSQHDSEPASFWSSRYAIGLVVVGNHQCVLPAESCAHFFGALSVLLPT